MSHPEFPDSQLISTNQESALVLNGGIAKAVSP